MSKSTDTITIRVPERLKSQLDSICKRQKINMNLLINQILEKSVNWDTHLSKMGWITLHPSVVREIMNYLTKEEMEDIASKISEDVIGNIKFLYGNNNLESLVKFFESWLQSTSSPYRYNESEHSHSFIVDHKLGKNWSEFAATVSNLIVEKSGFRIKNVEVGVNQYSYDIDKNSSVH